MSLPSFLEYVGAKFVAVEYYSDVVANDSAEGEKALPFLKASASLLPPSQRGTVLALSDRPTVRALSSSCPARESCTCRFLIDRPIAFNLDQKHFLELNFWPESGIHTTMCPWDGAPARSWTFLSLGRKDCLAVVAHGMALNAFQQQDCLGKLKIRPLLAQPVTL